MPRAPVPQKEEKIPHTPHTQPTTQYFPSWVHPSHQTDPTCAFAMHRCVAPLQPLLRRGIRLVAPPRAKTRCENGRKGAHVPERWRREMPPLLPKARGLPGSFQSSMRRCEKLGSIQRRTFRSACEVQMAMRLRMGRSLLCCGRNSARSTRSSLYHSVDDSEEPRSERRTPESTTALR